MICINNIHDVYVYVCVYTQMRIYCVTMRLSIKIIYEKMHIKDIATVNTPAVNTRFIKFHNNNNKILRVL